MIRLTFNLASIHRWSWRPTIIATVRGEVGNSQLQEIWLNTISLCTSLSVLFQADPLPETPQPQWWQSRWEQGGLVQAKFLTSQQDICGDHVGTSRWCLLIVHLGSPDSVPSSPIYLPFCDTKWPSDPSTLAWWVISQFLHLVTSNCKIVVALHIGITRCCTCSKVEGVSRSGGIMQSPCFSSLKYILKWSFSNACWGGITLAWRCGLPTT